MSYVTDTESLRAIIKKAEAKLDGARASFQLGFYDDVASRAYYADFHAVSAALAKIGLTFSSHGQTIGAFNREFVRTNKVRKDAFRLLQQLYDDRQIGDYDTMKVISKEDAERDLESATALVSECSLLVEGEK